MSISNTPLRFNVITYGSVCSGIESASVAWEPLGMQPLWFSEIEPFPCAVLEHHWPGVPNLGDMLALPALIRIGVIPAPDILVGGTPCQAFSVAGKRDSLDDDRGQLTLTYVDILNAIDEQRPGREAVCVWENVPGVLSTKDNAFGFFLGRLAGSGGELKPPGRKWGNAGYIVGPQRTIAWRTLDAQYFGVAQRRRRVFVVASARAGFDPGAVLFECDGVRRDSPPSRETGQEVAALTANGVGTCGADDNQGQAGHLIPAVAVRTANTSSNGLGVDENIAYTLDQAQGQAVVQGHRMQAFGRYKNDETASTVKARDHKDATDLIVCHGTQDPGVSKHIAYALGRNGGQGNAVAVGGNLAHTLRGEGFDASEDGTGRGTPVVASGPTVRRLTPVECERLQGFPDDHTRIPWRGKQPEDCPDGPRYRAIGNSKAVPVIRWLGRRLIAKLSDER